MEHVNKLVLILGEIVNLLSSIEDEERRFKVMNNLYIRCKEAKTGEIKVIAREILHMYGGMGSFFDEGFVKEEGEMEFYRLKKDLFNIALEKVE